MQFWHSAELLLDNDDPAINSIVGCVESAKVDANEASRDQKGNSYVVLVIFFVHLYSIHNLTLLYEFGQPMYC